MSAAAPRFTPPSDEGQCLIWQAQIAARIEQIAMLQGFDRAVEMTQHAISHTAEMMRRRGFSTGEWIG